LVVIAEPDIALGDCRIDWADGGVTRDRVATEAAIADAVSRYLAATRGTVLPELGETPR
jgi:flagellar assembly protein FliH